MRESSPAARVPLWLVPTMIGHAPAERRPRSDQRLAFLVGQTVRFAEDSEDRDAVDAEPDHELEQPLPRFQIQASSS